MSDKQLWDEVVLQHLRSGQNVNTAVQAADAVINARRAKFPDAQQQQ